MIWNIVTDSSCDLDPADVRRGETAVHYTSVPFILTVEDREFIDDDSLNREELLDTMEMSREASRSACPSPHTWEAAFRQEGPVVAITISKELSGSYNSACVARETVLESDPGKQIVIVNSASAGAGLVCLLRAITEEILAGHDFDTVAAKAHEFSDRMKTIFALCSFDNLVKNGRMSKIVGFIARSLGFWGIGIATPEGRIAIKGKERSTRKVIAAVLEDIRKNGRPARLMISHCQNLDMAERLRTAIVETWPEVRVEISDTKGLCSYYAERHGLIMAYL